MAFGDRMFQSNQGPSFPAHQYILSGTSAVTTGSSLLAAENPFHSEWRIGTGGCDSPGRLARAADRRGRSREPEDLSVLRSRLRSWNCSTAPGLSWRYYQAVPGGRPLERPRRGSLASAKARSIRWNVVHNRRRRSSKILPAGTLADVVWVTPTAFSSDHPADERRNGTLLGRGGRQRDRESQCWDSPRSS